MDESDESSDETGSSDWASSDDESSASDCGSSVTGPNCYQPPPISSDELQEGNRCFVNIRNKFFSCLDSRVSPCNIVSVRKTLFRSVRGQARLQAFQIFAKVLEQKNGGNPNVKIVWYGATRDEIKDILEHGFCQPKNNGLHGHGLYLYTDQSLMFCMEKSAVDENGLRYLLLCRVLVGRSEVVPPLSDQTCPTSPLFDSGVDNLTSPNKYIIWITHMNTHILPDVIISYKAPADLRVFKLPESPKNSPSIPIRSILLPMPKFLPTATMHLVLKPFKDLSEKKIPELEFLEEVRRLIGDKMLVDILKSLKLKPVPTSSLR